LLLCVSRMLFFNCFPVRPKEMKEGEIHLDPVMFIASMPKSIISISVWSSVIFLYCFLVRPKGIKKTKELVDGDRLDPFSFIASILPKSITSGSVWRMVLFWLFFSSPEGI